MTTSSLMQSEQHQSRDNQTIALTVKYITSKKHFVDSQASEDESLDALKPRVLDFFNLVEDGEKSYQFVLDGIVQTNLSETLGSLAEGKHELEFNLVEVLNQG
jgi:hypothetical protein